jgi:hypothetical protein
MSSTFEQLPDEILMIIFQYFGNVYTIFQTFLGLNQRLNNILIDKRLHLFTDFLCINVRDDYYNSEIFQQASQQLLSINTTIDKQSLSQFLQPLITFHIQQTYIRFGDELKSSLAKFTFLRQQLTNDEIVKIDDELKTQFSKLQNTPIKIEHIKYMKSLVLKKGARLECDNYELGEFNLAKTINNILLSHINDEKSKTSIPIHSFLELFKILIISNPSLLKNRDFVRNDGYCFQYFLIYAIYRLRSFYSRDTSSMPVNIEYYRATVDLCLFAIQSWKHVPGSENYIEPNAFDVLDMVGEVNEDVFIQTAQWEILKIVINEHGREANESWHDYMGYTFRKILTQLIEKRRLDVIKYLQSYFGFQDFFNNTNYIRRCVNIMTKNRSGRRLFCEIMDDKSLNLLFSKKDLLFIFLDKKERKLFEKLLKLSPDLIHQIDEDGNDPLLYICLKVSGLRHRIVESLIKMGSDLQRRNCQGQNFLDTLQLSRNKKLLQKIFEYEIVTLF